MQRVAFLMGGALSAPTMIAMLEGCKSDPTSEATTSGFSLSTDYKNLISEIAEIIIPKTATPGAKDAEVGPFIEMMLKDCYTTAQQEHFVKGLDTLEEASKKDYGKKFLGSTPEQQTTLLKKFEQMANEEVKQQKEPKKIVDNETGLIKDPKDPKTNDKTKKEVAMVPFFKLMKELTLLGYFTSEVGAKNALAYVAIPGRYEGCVKMTPGQKVWAL